MSETNRIKLERELERLIKQRRELMRGRVVPSSRAQIVSRKILELREEISRIDRDAAQRLALEKAPIDDVLEVIAIPLLADVMNDIVAGVDATLRRNKCQETVFGLYTSQIRKAAMAIVDTLAVSEENLPKLLDVDDTLVDAIKKKLMSFIKQRLKITKKCK